MYLCLGLWQKIFPIRSALTTRLDSTRSRTQLGRVWFFCGDRDRRPTGTVALTSRSRENSGCDRCRQDTTSIATQTQEQDILSVSGWEFGFLEFRDFGIERRWRAFRYRTAGTVVVGLSWLPCSRSPAKGLSVYVCIYGFGYKHTQLFRWDAGACVRFCVQPGIVLPPTAPPTFSHTNQHKSAKSPGYNTLTHTGQARRIG